MDNPNRIADMVDRFTAHSRTVHIPPHIEGAEEDLLPEITHGAERRRFTASPCLKSWKNGWTGS